MLVLGGYMGAIDEYYARQGTDQYGNKIRPGANTKGLNAANISTVYNPAQYSYSQYDANKNPIGPGTLTRAPSTTSTYKGAGGEYTSSGGGWTDASGRTITDLPGFLKKGSLQQSGADFTDYQKRLSSLIGDNSQDRYQQQLDAILADPSRIQQTAGYQFDVDQGNQAINRSAAARGQLGGGGVLAELAKYGQGMASKEYGNQVSRLANLSGAERENKGRNIDRMANLMQNAQQFGLGSGYYDELKPNNQITTGGGRSSIRAAPNTSLGGMDVSQDAYNQTQQQTNDYSSQLAKEHADWYRSRGLPVP